MLRLMQRAVFDGGMDIVESVYAVKREEDWSRVRSPSRARRRMKRGHRQNVVVTEKPAAYMMNGKLFAHPEFVRALNERLSSDLAKRMDDDMARVLRGGW